MRGTLLTNSSKYPLLINLAVNSLNNESALFNDVYTLIIQNFTTSDFGYYWCQIVVNDTCLLLPSPYGHIAENTTARACSTRVLRQLVLPPICAGSDSSIDKFTSSVSLPTTAATTQLTCDTQNDRPTSLCAGSDLSLDNCTPSPTTYQFTTDPSLTSSQVQTEDSLHTTPKPITTV